MSRKEDKSIVFTSPYNFRIDDVREVNIFTGEDADVVFTQLRHQMMQQKDVCTADVNLGLMTKAGGGKLNRGAIRTAQVMEAVATLRTCAAQNSDAILLWEYPEVFMPPALLNEVVAKGMELCAESGGGVRIFMVTYSLEVIATVAYRLCTQEREDALRLYRFEVEAGQMYIASYYHKNVVAWLEEGMDVRTWKLVRRPFRAHCRYEIGTKEEDETL